MDPNVEKAWVVLDETGVSRLVILMNERPSTISGFADCGDKPYCEVFDGKYTKRMAFDADRWHERFLDKDGNPVYCVEVVGYFRRNLTTSYLPTTFYITREFAQEILSEFKLPFRLPQESDPNDAPGSLYLYQDGAENLVGTTLTTKSGKTVKILEHDIGGWFQEVFTVEIESKTYGCCYRDIPGVYGGTPQEEFHKELYSLLHD